MRQIIIAFLIYNQLFIYIQLIDPLNFIFYSLGILQILRLEFPPTQNNGLVTDGNTKLCCRGFILTLFQSTTANKNDFEHT